jgi:hypothetical protein
MTVSLKRTLPTMAYIALWTATGQPIVMRHWGGSSFGPYPYVSVVAGSGFDWEYFWFSGSASAEGYENGYQYCDFGGYGYLPDYADHACFGYVPSWLPY